MRAVRVLVTGGSGFVGGAIISRLEDVHPEYEIICLDINGPKGLDGDDGEGEKVRHAYVNADIRMRDQLINVFDSIKPHVVIHTASFVPGGHQRYSREAYDKAFEINVKGAANVLEATKVCGAKVLLYTSTCCIITDDFKHEYPNYNETFAVPKSSSVYGETKAQAESMIIAANSPELITCALRPSVILGEEDYQLVPAIHACIAKGETPYIVGTGDNLFDFTYVGNVADAHVLAVENLLSSKIAAGEVISISNGQPVPFRDFCLAVWAAFGHAPPFTLKIPTRIAWFAGLMLECWSGLMGLSAATLSRGSVNDAVGTRYADIAKAKKILGYEPRVDLADAVKISCRAYAEKLERAAASSK